MRALFRVGRALGRRVWIVGGALRDALLGRPVAEIDVAVEGDAGAVAAGMEAAAVGRAVLLSGERAPRVYRIAGRARIVDVAEIEAGGIEADLGRRDFTANAIARELGSGTILDPHGGRLDLRDRRLRMVAAKNLLDDPLRSLRAARLFATHGLAPDRATSAACRLAAGRLETVAVERVQSEIARLLDAPRAAPAVAWAARTGVLAPALRLSPNACRRIASRAAALDAPGVRRLAPGRRGRVRLAWMASGAGLSPREATSWLKHGRFPAADAIDVGSLLDLARRAIRPAPGEDDWRWLFDAGDRARDALTLASLFPDADRGRVERLRRRAARLRPVPRVGGGDVMLWLGIRPGPQVGRLLDRVRIEALAGRIRTRREARRWLSSHPEAGS
jgi:tRNA nucleotidyltransferase/poly(A) polymerase